jgi:tetratricopeptide (TPR) repeat protein
MKKRFMIVVACLAACAPVSMQKRSIDDMMTRRDFAGAENYIVANKDSMNYGDLNAQRRLGSGSGDNRVLYYLDLGTVLHHGGKLRESDALFDQAERRFDELYTVSLSNEGVAMLLTNDKTMDYRGEAFERALISVYRAINYALLGQTDEAAVEARKIARFLDLLNRARGGQAVYKDDAFAQYLSALLFDDAGQPDDARISMDAARSAYAQYATAFGTPFPEFAGASGGVAPPEGELVFIHYNGVGPRKVSETFEGVAVPAYVQDPYSIRASQVHVEDRSQQTLLVESVTKIAQQDIKDRWHDIVAHAKNRRTTKTIGFGLTGRLLSEKTDTADLRGWSALPAEIRLARLRLPAGTHDVSIEFKDESGKIVSSDRVSGVKISAGRRTYLAYRTAN